MAVREIVLYPHPILKMKCAPADWREPAVQELCQDLEETLAASPGVGIAAPQIGTALRVFVVTVAPKEPNNGFLLLLNPILVAQEGRVTGREGCLSIPEFTANVTRFEKTRVRGSDRQGCPVEIESSGFEAICLQHELDHLDGVLFLDRVACLKSDVFKRKGGQPRYSLEDVARLQASHNVNGANIPSIPNVVPSPGGHA